MQSYTNRCYTDKRKAFFLNCSTLETGLSDFHKMILTCWRAKLPKGPTKIFHYRNMKNFNGETFCSDLETADSETCQGILDAEASFSRYNRKKRFSAKF